MNMLLGRVTRERERAIKHQRKSTTALFSTGIPYNFLDCLDAHGGPDQRVFHSCTYVNNHSSKTAKSSASVLLETVTSSARFESIPSPSAQDQETRLQNCAKSFESVQKDSSEYSVAVHNPTVMIGLI